MSVGGGVMIDVVPSEGFFFFQKDHLFDLCGRLEKKIMQCVCFVTCLAFNT